ncbi:MAG TPA: methyl-accepting chemotaxis protein [Gemmatimonadales bacterium]|nr:methyl-accepting chemotaxis protein [Gemmatimonadales bacterium]
MTISSDLAGAAPRRSLDVPRVLALYARTMRVGGLGLAAVVLATDHRWLHQPVACLIVLAAVIAVRAAPVRLSKYSYLTQTGIPALGGALTVGPGPVVLGLALGIAVCDLVWLRKHASAALVNAGREVIAFVSAFGCYALVFRLSGSPALSLDFLPAGFTLIAIYFLASRALFYFTLLLRSKLESAEELLILRWEVVSYLITVIGCLVVVGAVRALAPGGWAAVALVLGVLGLLTRRILEEAIAAEDLGKVHMMELAIASNLSLEGSFEQVERVGYRLLDWGDFRIYRAAPGGAFSLAYRSTQGRPRRRAPDGLADPIRVEVADTGRPILVSDVARDARIALHDPDIASLIVQPLRFGDDFLGTVEVDHYKRNAYGPKDLAAIATLAAQISTAIHIAELRRPLASTVDQISQQVGALARATQSLRASAAALTQASRAMSGSVEEQESFVRSGLEATDAMAGVSADMAAEGARAAAASGRAAETASANRAVVAEAIGRLVELKRFVAESSEQVNALGDVSRRVTGFIGSIREIADLTNLIALNAAIEAARAGKEGRGFAIVAEEVRQLAAQSLAAAREAGGLVADVTAQVTTVSRQMQHGEEAVAGVEELSGAAASAFDAIVDATGEAGTHARRIADMAASQEATFDTLSDRIRRVADASSRMGGDTRLLAAQAEEAARGQNDLETAIRELGEVAFHLQTIARHFAVGA